MDDMVYPFAPNKKLYQVNGEWVKASCGGENILGEGHELLTWDGKQDTECLMIDNFDSFTYNVVQYLGELGHKPSVYRNDIPLEKIQNMQ